MKKIERLISIIMILLQKRLISTSELSKIFGVSSRTIQRDMDSLALANIPIYSIRGSQGGYGLTEEYKFDKRLLTTNDIENILIALNGLEQLLVTNEIRETIEKIKGMTLKTIESDINVTFYSFPGRVEIMETVLLLKEAIGNQRQISFIYTNQSGKTEEKIIEPYRLFLNETRWYIYGYDINKKEFRLYKIARMASLDKKRSFTPRNEIPNPKSKKYIQETTEVTLEISQKVIEQFIERYGTSTLKPLTNDKYSLIIDIPANRFAYQFLSGFGHDIKIISPKYYIDNFREFLQTTLNQYE